MDPMPSCGVAWIKTSRLAAIEAGWTAATEQYKAGDWGGAVARAKDLSAKGKELLHSIGTR